MIYEMTVYKKKFRNFKTQMSEFFFFIFFPSFTPQEFTLPILFSNRFLYFRKRRRMTSRYHLPTIAAVAGIALAASSYVLTNNSYESKKRKRRVRSKIQRGNLFIFTCTFKLVFFFKKKNKNL